MNRVREPEDPQHHEREEQKWNQARLDLHVFNGGGKLPATLIREHTADHAENQRSQQQRAKGMQKDGVRRTPIEQRQARAGEPAARTRHAGYLVKYTGNTDVKVTRHELGGGNAGNSQRHGAEAENLGKERNAEGLEASEHRLKIP